MQLAGITQTELAEYVGKSRSYVAAILNKKRSWPKGDLKQRCDEFVSAREAEAATVPGGKM